MLQMPMQQHELYGHLRGQKLRIQVAWSLPLGRGFTCHYLPSPLGTVARFHFLKEWSPSYWMLLPTSQAIWTVAVRWPMVVQHPLLRIADFARFWISISSCSFTGSLHLSVTLWCFLFCTLWAEHADHGICHRVHMGTAGCSVSASWMVWCTGTSNCIHQLLTNCDNPFSIIQSCAELRCGHSVMMGFLHHLKYLSCFGSFDSLQAWHLGPQSGNPAWLLSKQPSSQRTKPYTGPWLHCFASWRSARTSM